MLFTVERRHDKVVINLNFLGEPIHGSPIFTLLFLKQYPPRRLTIILSNKASGFNERGIPSRLSKFSYYMGTFSKSLSPDLRVAYIVLPKSLLKDYQRIFSHANCDVSSLIQYTLALFIHTGEYQKHINAMRTNYQKKHDYIAKFFNERFPDSAQASLLGQNGGLHFILSLPLQVKQKDFLTACAEEKVRICLLEKFRMDGSLCTGNQFLLGFGPKALRYR